MNVSIKKYESQTRVNFMKNSDVISVEWIKRV